MVKIMPPKHLINRVGCSPALVEVPQILLVPGHVHIIQLDRLQVAPVELALRRPALAKVVRAADLARQPSWRDHMHLLHHTQASRCNADRPCLRLRSWDMHALPVLTSGAAA